MKQRRAVLITGVSSGIGRALALEFARRGDSVVGLSRNRRMLKGLEREIRAEGGDGMMIPCDVRDERRVSAAIKKCVAHAGAIDFLVNNAGVTSFKNFLATPFRVFDEILDTNLKGAMIATRAVLPSMVRRKKGTIISIISYATKTVYQGASAYSAAKAGLAAMMSVIREEVRPSGVKVINVYPGAILTPMWTRQQRSKYSDVMISPDDFARLLYEVSVQPSSMTVEELVVRPPIGDLRV